MNQLQSRTCKGYINSGHPLTRSSEDSVAEEPEALFFMEPDHKEVRMNEDLEAQDHSQKSCYHCSCKGHIKANRPEKRKLGARP